MRNTAGKWLVATAVVGGLLIPGSSALAAKTTPSNAAQSSNANICLMNAPSYCIKTNGTGNQVTITNYSPNYANFRIARSSADGLGDYYLQWEDGNGNCLREGTGNVVKIENGSCSNGDKTAWWFALGIFATEYGHVENQGYGQFMLTRGAPTSGNKVFAYSSISSGDWAKWYVPTPP